MCVCFGTPAASPSRILTSLPEYLLEQSLRHRLSVVDVTAPNVTRAHNQRTKKLGGSSQRTHTFGTRRGRVPARGMVNPSHNSSYWALFFRPETKRLTRTASWREDSRQFCNFTMLIEKPPSVKASGAICRVADELEHHGGAIGVGHML
jgi:hypothetical protein